MKTIFTRTVMVALLATSISAFAQSSEGKTDDAINASNVNVSNVTQQDDVNQNANRTGMQDRQKSGNEQKIEQEDKEWLHDLRGDYGG